MSTFEIARSAYRVSMSGRHVSLMWFLLGPKALMVVETLEPT